METQGVEDEVSDPIVSCGGDENTRDDVDIVPPETVRDGHGVYYFFASRNDAGFHVATILDGGSGFSNIGQYIAVSNGSIDAMDICLETRRLAAVHILDENIVELRIHCIDSGNVELKWTDPSLSARSQPLFNHSGSQILTADSEMILWDAHSAAKLATLTLNVAWSFPALCFSCNDEFVLVYRQGHFGCWKADTGEEVQACQIIGYKFGFRCRIVPASDDTHCAMFGNSCIEVRDFISAGIVSVHALDVLSAVGLYIGDVCFGSDGGSILFVLCNNSAQCSVLALNWATNEVIFTVETPRFHCLEYKATDDTLICASSSAYAGNFIFGRYNASTGEEILEHKAAASLEGTLKRICTGGREAGHFAVIILFPFTNLSFVPFMNLNLNC